MTRRERKILYAGIAMALIFGLSRGLPFISQTYADRKNNIEFIRDDIAREERLIENAALWNERREAIETQLQNLDTEVFQGDAIPLLTANIQRMVRQYATDTGISISSTRLAEPLRGDGWLLVEQELSFTLDSQNNTLEFLRRIEQSRPYLGITSFNMRRNRNQYSGAITVVGFSRTAEAATRTTAGNGE